MSAFLRDFRLALRLAARHRASSVAAGLVLCLGIGPTTAIFSVVHATLIAPLPYPQPDQLVMVWSQASGGRNAVSVGDYLEWKERATSFQFLEPFVYGERNLATASDPERVQVRLVSADGHRLHGLPMWLGRDFLPGEDQPGRDHVVLLSHDLWYRRFAADPKIVGRDIRLDSQPYTVVGVLAPGLWDRIGGGVWIPLAFTPDQKTHDLRWLLILGRLKPGVTLPQAQEEMRIITADMAGKYPMSNTGWSASVEPLQNNFLAQSTQTNLWLLLAAVGFVVVIACVNVASLLLARGTARETEAAIRASLGATSGRLFRQMLTESLVLAGVGGVLGVLSSIWILRGLLALLPPYTLPAEADPQVNLPVLGFALATTVTAGLVFGTAPAWHVAGVDLVRTLRQGSRTAVAASRRGLLRTLVVAELALAVALLAGAGLTIHSFWNRARVDLGINPDGVLTFGLLAQEGRLQGAEQIDAFYRTLLDRLEALPGVSHAAIAPRPALQPGFATEFGVAGRTTGTDTARPNALFRMVSPGFVDTFGIRLARGRGFTAGDRAGAQYVAMVNERFVERFLPGLDPLRERLLIAERIPGAMTLGRPIEWQIVGVFRNVSNGQEQLGDPTAPEIYVPFSQSPWPQVSAAVRTTRDSETMARAVTAVVRSLDSGLPVSNVLTMNQFVSRFLANDRLNMALIAGLAAVALALAAVGIYGVMTFLVAQRTSEIGLRVALGANRARLIAQILREGLVLAGFGLAFGLFGAYFVGRAIERTLFGTTALDLRVLLAVCALLLVTALAACYVPARRASGVDPMAALRQS